MLVSGLGSSPVSPEEILQQSENVRVSLASATVPPAGGEFAQALSQVRMQFDLNSIRDQFSRMGLSADSFDQISTAVQQYRASGVLAFTNSARTTPESATVAEDQAAAGAGTSSSAIVFNVPPIVDSIDLTPNTSSASVRLPETAPAFAISPHYGSMTYDEELAPKSGAADSFDAYWNAQPPEVQKLRYMQPQSAREQEATRLTGLGFTIDGLIMVEGWNPVLAMKARADYGYTWVPAWGQAPAPQPGVNFPGANPYDAGHPPEGSIPVNFDVFRGTTLNPLYFADPEEMAKAIGAVVAGPSST